MKNSKLLLMGLLAFLTSCSQDESINEIANESNAMEVQDDFTEIAFPDQEGNWSDVYLYGRKLPVEEIGGKFVYQGDIFLPENQVSRTPQNLILQAGEDAASKSVGRTRFLWPENIVFYSIDPSLPSQQRVLDAIAHWESNTAVRFVERTDQSNYVYFTPGSGCSSYVGMVGGKQYITLADACSTGNAIHEIGHSLGLWHEQSRADRDEVITIHYDNIVSGREYNFYTYEESGWDGAEYTSSLDLGSIMMYSSYSFSANGQPTITRKDGSTFRAQRSGLSAGDIEGVNTLYPGSEPDTTDTSGTDTSTGTDPDTSTGGTETGTGETGGTETGTGGTETGTGGTETGSGGTETSTGGTTEPTTTTPTETEYINGETYTIEGVTVLRLDNKWWVYRGKSWKEVELVNGRWRYVK